MKKIVITVLALAALASCAKEDPAVTPQEGGTEETSEAVDHSVVQGESVVLFSDDMIDLIESDLDRGKIATRSMGLNQALDELGISSIRRLFPDAGEYEPRTRREGLHKWYVVTYKEDVPQTRAEAELGGVSGIEYVEPHRVAVTADFNDPQLSKQWGYVNENGCDINVAPVWNAYTTGDSKVIVAVVDQGVDITHEDLAANCGTQHYNSISGVGSVVAGDHGTHVAGTIAAVNNNGIGVCGVAGGDAAAGRRGVTIMSCEILREVQEGGKTKTLNGSSSEAIKWAADHGAVICQNSWGYSYDSDGDGQYNDEERAKALAAKIGSADKAAVDYFIKYAGCDNDGNQLPDSPMKGGLVVFAAGNENLTNAAPANYEPIIAVGALDSDGSKAYYSNYGDFVDIAAPGTSVYSTKMNGQYGSMSGTSMACPHVSGVAALVVSYFGGQDFTCDELKERILNSKRTSAAPSNLGGLVDAMGALTYGHDFIPGKTENLAAAAHSNNLDLTWTVSGDSEGHPAYGFSIVYGTDKAEVEAADPSAGSKGGVKVKNIFPEAAVGKTVSLTIDDLEFSTVYYIKVAGYSYARSYGEASDILAASTQRNEPPVVESDYTGPLTLKAHETKVINFKIYDPDGHKFTVDYKKGSAADAISVASDGNGTVTIKAYEAEPGTYTCVITTTDAYGASSALEVVYTVLQNNPPTTVKPIDNMLFTTTGAEFFLNIADYFEDPDGETLKFKIEVSNPKVAYVAQNVDRLIGTVLQFGSTAVTVTAYDAKGAEVSTAFNILAREASVEYSAYPNPVKDVLNLATGESLEDVAVKIVSQTGSVVFEDTVKASAFVPAQIDLSKCAPGRYTATFTFGSKEHKQTIVKI